MGFPWLADGIANEERHALDSIKKFIAKNDALDQVVLGFPWLADGIANEERHALDHIGRLIANNDALAQVVLGFPWLADGITKDERLALGSIWPIGANHAGTWVIPGLPWLTDGVTASERGALSTIQAIAKTDSGIVNSVLNSPLFDGESRSLQVDLLNSLGLVYAYSSRFESSLFEQMINQEWFQDGLSDEEAALIVVLKTDIGHANTEEFFQDLIQGGHVHSETFSLPSGEGKLFLIRRPSLEYADNSVFEWMSTRMEAIEDFTGTPWMKSDVILYVEPEFPLRGIGLYGGRNDLSHMIVKMDPGESSIKEIIYHELGHYYSRGGPEWLREGAAEFLRSYTVHLSENVSLQSRYDLAQKEVANKCSGATNVQEWIDAPTPTLGAVGQCPYEVGESFLLGMYLGLGHEAVLSSLEDLLDEGRRATEDVIYQVFLANAPPEKQDEFHDLYRRLHGRPLPGWEERTGQLPSTPDTDALVALYNATNGANWKANWYWRTDVPLEQWHGVDTDGNDRVVKLLLVENKLAGAIPAELDSLSNLEDLSLARNRLTGPIPPELGRLSNLQQLYLGVNQLTGPIPPELGRLSNLQQLYLGVNQLTGPIPPELGRLSGLNTLYLAGNQLTGPIPPELGRLSGLNTLYLAGNQLTGCIPEGLRNVPENDFNKLGLPFC